MRNLNLGMIGTIHLYVSYGCVIDQLVRFLVQVPVDADITGLENDFQNDDRPAIDQY